MGDESPDKQIKRRSFDETQEEHGNSGSHRSAGDCCRDSRLVLYRHSFRAARSHSGHSGCYLYHHQPFGLLHTVRAIRNFDPEEIVA